MGERGLELPGALFGIERVKDALDGAAWVAFLILLSANLKPDIGRRP